MGESNGSVILMDNEVFFNELCLKDNPNDYSVLTNLKMTYLKLKEKGFSICRIDGVSKQRAIEYLESIGCVSIHVLRGFLYSFFHGPYEKADISKEQNELSLSTDLYYEGERAEGFLWAHVFDSLSFSLLTNSKWDTSYIEVIDRANSNKCVVVHHACTVENINKQIEWIDSQKTIEIITTNELPANKHFNLAGTHHGNRELRQFWHKIRKSAYIVSCINSTEFHSYEKKLVREIHPDGKIEIVLFWEEAGYSMVLQTTGRNYRETKAIAEILSEEYSK